MRSIHGRDDPAIGITGGCRQHIARRLRSRFHAILRDFGSLPNHLSFDALLFVHQRVTRILHHFRLSFHSNISFARHSTWRRRCRQEAWCRGTRWRRQIDNEAATRSREEQLGIVNINDAAIDGEGCGTANIFDAFLSTRIRW